MTKPFYTHYSTFKDKIYLRYVDSNNKRRSDIIDFEPSYYLSTSKNSSTKDSKVKTIYGNPLVKKTSKNARTFAKDIKKYDGVHGMTVYGMRNAALQYVSERFPDNLLETFRPEQIRRIEIDIETLVDVSVGFPKIEGPEEEVALITMYDTLYGKTIIFYINEVNWKSPSFKGKNIHPVQCEDEQDLLRKFVKFWEMDYPDVVVGWNISNFDIPFLVNRIEKILGTAHMKLLSPLGRINKKTGFDEKGRQTFDYTIGGVEIIDSYDMYKKIEMTPRENYSLEFISNVELGAGKLRHPSGIAGHLLYREHDLNKINSTGDWGEWEHQRIMIQEWKRGGGNDHILRSEIYKLFYEAYVLYNIIDVERAYQIGEQKDLFQIAYYLAYFSYSNFGEVISSMRFWTNLLTVYCFDDLNIALEINPPKKEKTGKFTGAYVRSPLVGKYNGAGCTTTYDVESMYPNILRILNISPEKLIEGITYPGMTVQNMLAGKIPKIDPNHTVAANGIAFRKDSIGVLPRKIEELFNLRKAEKGGASALKPEIYAMEVELKRRKDKMNA